MLNPGVGNGAAWARESAAARVHIGEGLGLPRSFSSLDARTLEFHKGTTDEYLRCFL